MDSIARLSEKIKMWGVEAGFQQTGITTTTLDKDEAYLLDWLKKGRHGSMDYMERHGLKRTRPARLVPGTISVISVRMDYWPRSSAPPSKVLKNRQLAYISRYALGRDYHKLMRRRLQKLAKKIEGEVGAFGYRCFVDSAPVLEKALARNAGLGWIGKHSNLINPKAGSWFFLGEIYTDLPLIADETFSTQHCGSCDACIKICPTQAIIGPMQIDARRCISYLTIELKGSIPVEFRKQIGNRIYGCDDCQLVCPWNKFAQYSKDDAYRVRHGLDMPELLHIFFWSETMFLQKTEGSAIRRIGYTNWIRNIAIALGNTKTSSEIITALSTRLSDPSAIIREHVHWALQQHQHARSVL